MCSYMQRQRLVFFRCQHAICCELNFQDVWFLKKSCCTVFFTYFVYYTYCLVSWWFAIFYSSLGRDRTSACKGASGCRYQSIFDLTYPPDPCMTVLFAGLRVITAILSTSEQGYKKRSQRLRIFLYPLRVLQHSPGIRPRSKSPLQASFL